MVNVVWARIRVVDAVLCWGSAASDPQRWLTLVYVGLHR
jgi:hypothetical protein